MKGPWCWWERQKVLWLPVGPGREGLCSGGNVERGSEGPGGEKSCQWGYYENLRGTGQCGQRRPQVEGTAAGGAPLDHSLHDACLHCAGDHPVRDFHLLPTVLLIFPREQCEAFAACSRKERYERLFVILAKAGASVNVRVRETIVSFGLSSSHWFD